MAERAVTAGDDALDEFVRSVEGGRTFGGVENTEAAGGASAGIEQMAVPDSRESDDGVDGAADVREFTLDGEGNFLIGVVDDAEHVDGGQFSMAEEAGFWASVRSSRSIRFGWEKQKAAKSEPALDVRISEKF